MTMACTPWMTETFQSTSLIFFCFFLFTKKGGDDGLHALDDGDSGEPAAARGVP